MKNTMKKLLIVSSAIATIMSSASAGGAPIQASNIAAGGSLVLDGATLELASGSTVTNQGTIEAKGAANINVAGNITNTGIIDLSAITTGGQVTALNVTGTTSTLEALTAGADAPANAIILGKDGSTIISPDDITSITVSNNQYVQYFYANSGTQYTPTISSTITFSGTVVSSVGTDSTAYTSKVTGGGITWHNKGTSGAVVNATIDDVNTANTGNRTDVTLDLDTATGFTPTLNDGETYVKLKNAETGGNGIIFGGDANTTYYFFGDNSGVQTAMNLPNADLVFGADNALFKHNDATVKEITFNGGENADHAENTLSATLTAEKLTVDQYADLANGGKNITAKELALNGTLTLTGGTLILGED